MNIETLAEIQPYIDEYCNAESGYKSTRGLTRQMIERKIIFKEIMNEAEKAIMQILIDSNCKEITE